MIARQYLDNVDREHNVVTLELRKAAKNFSDLDRVKLSVALRFTQSRRGAAPLLAAALRAGDLGSAVAETPAGQAYRAVLRKEVLARRINTAAEEVLRKCPFPTLKACRRSVSAALGRPLSGQTRRELGFHADEVAADLAGWRRSGPSPFIRDTSARLLGPGARRGIKRDGVFASGEWPQLDKRAKGDAMYLAASKVLAQELGETQPTIEVALCSYESYRVVETRGVTQPFVAGRGRPRAPALDLARASA